MLPRSVNQNSTGAYKTIKEVAAAGFEPATKGL